MKIALVYDRINKFGGAERLLLSLHKLYPEAPIYTLVHNPVTSGWAKNLTIIPTFLNSIPFLRTRHEVLAPLAPLAFETLDFTGFDIVITLTASDAKSIITKPNQLHVCYCLTPTRYFWSGEKTYLKNWKLKLLPKFIHRYFKNLDLLTSERPDEYISISNEVMNRVKKYYKRNSSVIYPPIEDKFYTKVPISMAEREYFMVAGRLVPYKRVDLVISVFNKLKLPLVVIGTGSEEARLKKMSGPNITFLGQVSDAKLIECYRHAKALIFPAEEDFGLVPVEAQASGTPVIAFSKGGAVETVIDQKTGVLFDSQSESSLSDAISKFDDSQFDSKACIANARNFNQAKFAREFAAEVDRLWIKYHRN